MLLSPFPHAPFSTLYVYAYLDQSGASIVVFSHSMQDWGDAAEVVGASLLSAQTGNEAGSAVEVWPEISPPPSE